MLGSISTFEIVLCGGKTGNFLLQTGLYQNLVLIDFVFSNNNIDKKG
jgi:hypothetical protein